MKKPVILCVFVLAALCFTAAESGDERFCPLYAGQEWTYSFFSKRENVQKDDLHTYIKKNRMFRGTLCQVYESPSKALYLYLYSDTAGVYVKGATVSMPLLGFINIDIEFKPPAQGLKFPLRQGDKWHYEGIASATTCAFIQIDTKVSGDIGITGIEKVEAYGVTYTAWHISGSASRTWGAEKPIKGECWLVDGKGIIRGETANTRIELKEYKYEAEAVKK